MENTEPADQPKSKSKTSTGLIAGIIVIAIFVIVALLLLLQGQTSTTGAFPDNVSDESLSCSRDGIDYPFYAYDNAERKTVEIRILFAQDQLKSIALTYSLYYSDPNIVTASEAHNHAEMNKSFARNGLDEADAYNAKYSRMADRMQMNLYAPASKFDDTASRYFLLGDEYGVPSSLDGFKQAYQAQGFFCEITSPQS